MVWIHLSPLASGDFIPILSTCTQISLACIEEKFITRRDGFKPNLSGDAIIRKTLKTVLVTRSQDHFVVITPGPINPAFSQAGQRWVDL